MPTKAEVRNALVAGHNAKLSGYHVIDINKLPSDQEELEKIMARAELIQQIQRAGGYSFDNLNKKKTKELAEIWKKVYGKSKLPKTSDVIESHKAILGMGTSRRSASPKTKKTTGNTGAKLKPKAKKPVKKNQCTTVFKRPPTKKTRLSKANVEKCCKQGGWKKTEILSMIHEHNDKNHRPKIRGNYGKKTSKKSVEELCSDIRKKLKYN